MEAHNILVVSDLHLGEGKNPKTGTFSRLEDFVYDEAFARFLRYHQDVRHQPRFGGRPWLLILNGDILDFLQVVSLPEEGRMLRTVKDVARYSELTPKDRAFGLGTTPEEAEWKMKRIARGHQPFFAALGRFVAQGNHVAVVKGNHDIELHWPQVQERFGLEAYRAYNRQRLARGEGPQVTSDEFKDHLRFYPWFYYEPGRLYVEHGGQYESANSFDDYQNPVMVNRPHEIEFPWGSMFVRYLFNELEDVHPFADNVRPLSRYLSWAFRRDPMTTLELLLTRGGTFLRAFWNVAHKSVETAIQRSQVDQRDVPVQPDLLPPEVTDQIKVMTRVRREATQQEMMRATVRTLPKLVSLGLMVLSVIAALRGVWWAVAAGLIGAVGAQLLGRVMERRTSHRFMDYLVRTARDIEELLTGPHAVSYIVMGHTHMADVVPLEQAWYVNVGTWLPFYEQKGPIEGREELTYFRHIEGDEGTPELLRWDDAGGEPARARLGLL